MKILQIAPQIPFPLDHGGRISIGGITKYLASRGHEIHFVTYNSYDSSNDIRVNELSKFAIPYVLEVNTENNLLGAIKNLVSPVPYNISKYVTKELKEFLIEFFRKSRVDIVHIDHLHMGWCVDFIREISDVPVVIREHNLELKIMKRYFEYQNNFILKNFARIQYMKFMNYEPRLLEKFDKCIMISSKDEKDLKLLSKNVDTVTITVGVDEQLLKIEKQTLIPNSMFYIGATDWLPNKDGLMWYLEEIFPKIISKLPDVKLYLYGNGTDRIPIAETLKKNIVCKGYVKSIMEEVNDKQLMIVPLRIGSGIRVKIIEMLGIGQNILTTSVGKEGIDAKDGESIIVADNSDEFINKTVAFFHGEFNAKQISINAKELIRSKFTWNKIAEEFESLYLDLINVQP